MLDSPPSNPLALKHIHPMRRTTLRLVPTMAVGLHLPLSAAVSLPVLPAADTSVLSTPTQVQAPLPSTQHYLSQYGHVRFAARPEKPPMNTLTASLPTAPQDPTLIETLHGRPVADPFRPLEHLDAPEVQRWVAAQNERTQAFLKPAEAAHKATVNWHRQIRDYVREGLPTEYGPNTFSWQHRGLDPQPVYLVRRSSPEAAPDVLLDPNTLSADGTVAIQAANPSPQGDKLAYLLSEAGSDNTTLRVRDVATGHDLPDVLKDLRFTDATWDPSGKSLTYGRPVSDGKHFAIYRHTLGTPQDQDVKLIERPDVPNSHLGSFRLQDDDPVLFISVASGTHPENGLYYQHDGETTFHELLPPGQAILHPVHRDGDTLLAITDLDAPRKRLVSINLKQPDPAHWQTLIPEADNPAHTLDGAFVTGGRLFTQWTRGGVDALESVDVSRDPRTQTPQPVDTPLGVSIGVGQVRPQQTSFLLATNGYLAPSDQYRLDVAANRLTLVKKSAIARDLTDTATVERVYATSKDGTKVPMWVIAPKNLPKDGTAPALLYGYGGFNAPLKPGFSFNIMHWVEHGGVYAVANLRGGGEFGRPWYDGGRLKNKQNVFDDFAACAEELAKRGYTRPERLAISGGSNGGLLTAAVSQQYPERIGAAISAVPVTDMLRFHTDNFGAYWMSDYGDPGKPDDFETALKYSPLHTVRPASEVRYPPTLFTTADHDNRVAPWHAYKLTAERQAKGHANTYLRVDTRAGHGAGKPTEKVIQEAADQTAFLVQALGLGDAFNETKH